jgi:hypothetical protein
MLRMKRISCRATLLRDFGGKLSALRLGRGRINNSPKRLLGPSAVFVLLAMTVAMSFLMSGRSSLAKDWKCPTQFVGLSGKVGTYEEVQKDLEHLVWQDVQPTHEASALSLKDLYDGQMAWRSEIENIDVSFEYSLQRQKNTAQVIGQKQRKRAVPDDYAFEARVAMKGEKRFTHIRDTTPSKTLTAAAGNSKSTPGSKRPPEFVYAYNGAAMKSFEPFRSIGHIHRAKLDSVDSRHMWYFDSISIPTGARAAKQSESAWYLPIALSLPSVYRVLPTLQVVDGFHCHVVTSGPDTMWIDVEHGFSLRRRVWFQMTNLERAPVLAYIYVNKDFRQEAANTWLPHQCYRLDFAGTLEPPNTHGTLTEVHAVTARTINVNTVSDGLFELTFPPGTSVQDLVANKSYLVPQGEHLLDDAIARANPIVNGEVRPFRSATAFRSVWGRLFILNAVMLGLVGGRLLWRLRSGRAGGA